MSQFANRSLADQKDVKLDVKLDVKQPDQKIILLAEVDVCKEDLRELYKNTSVCLFDAEVQFDSNILTILERFDLLLIDIRKDKDLRWYRLMRSAIEKKEEVNVVYLHQRGVPITTKEHLRENLSADYIVKELPKKDDYNGKADFIFKLLSDHIPIQRNWFAVAKNALGCLLSCVASAEEKQKN